MDSYLEKLKRELELRVFSRSTQKSYLLIIKEFLNLINRPPEELDFEDIKIYQYRLLSLKKLNPRTINHYTSAVLFFYQKILNKYYHPQQIVRMRYQKKIPTTLTQEEIQKILSVTTNLKEKAIIMTLYSAGLRVSEVINLRPTDIDSKRMVIIVRNGKGGKDRHAILSPILLEHLRKFWITRKKESTWLFPGTINYRPDVINKNPKISDSGIRKIIKRSAKAASINKEISAHTFRHSFAVHLLESGTNLRYIQILLGHASISSTTAYTHIANISTMKVTSPLDTLFTDGK